jgi:hypothetical protein
VLIGIGKSNHPTGAAGPDDGVSRAFQPDLNRVSGFDRQGLAIVDDQSDAGHRSRQQTT